jgi:hypothetical protein
MSTIVLLDAGPLGMLCNPNATPTTRDCNLWLEALLQKGAHVYIPEIADYEIRRELLRIKHVTSIQQLDALKQQLMYLPLTTPMMLKAAEFWAQMRQQGLPTAHEKALDADVILAAQAAILSQSNNTVIIATTNVGHLSRMVTAFPWPEIA